MSIQTLQLKHNTDNDALATPHRGSSVLSEPEYVQTVQKTLGLKWEMSEHLRQEFSVQNRDLEILDYKFGPAALGMKIWSLVETRETQLKVLSTGDVGGETLTPVKLSIVDSRSAVLSTTDVPVEEEEIFRLDATHVGVPRFANDDIIRRRYLEDLAEFIQHFSVHEREAHHQLASSIMTDIHVDIHQFYEFGPSGEQEKAPLKVWSERPTLRTFLEEGPAQCLRRRFKASVEQPDENGQPDSSTEVRRSTKAVAPTIVVAPPTELPEAIPPRDDRTSLTARVSEKLTTIHTRRPSLTPRPSTEPIMTGNGHLAPQAASPPVKEFEYQDIDSARPPQKPPTYQLPSSNRDRFRWIHIPYTHAGWVPVSKTYLATESEGCSRSHAYREKLMLFSSPLCFLFCLPSISYSLWLHYHISSLFYLFLICVRSVFYSFSLSVLFLLLVTSSCLHA